MGWMGGGMHNVLRSRACPPVMMLAVSVTPCPVPLPDDAYL